MVASLSAAAVTGISELFNECVAATPQDVKQRVDWSFCFFQISFFYCTQLFNFSHTFTIAQVSSSQ